LIILTLLALQGVACAGPTTPFGALRLFSKDSAESEARGPASLFGKDFEFEETGPSVHFYPPRQVLHTRTTFAVEIEDPKGVPEEPNIALFYNGFDVTKEFLAQATRTDSDPQKKKVRLATKNLRLVAGRENRIHFLYWPKEAKNPVVAQYHGPSCFAFDRSQRLERLTPFRLTKEVLRTIDEEAAQKEINPFFLAGLIAQESSFNPLTVSRNKALGLTQITSLGETEIIEKFADWPRHPEIAEMPFPILKLAILNGDINPQNEWRLDPERSIRGGAEYLSYLHEYWNRGDKRMLLEEQLGERGAALSEVLLASYNSGAARVSQALERRGPDWLEDEELNEARKYVGRVVSWCDQLALRSKSDKPTQGAR
jgi:soluble lytic murein transglycosylase-like protein